MLTATVNSVSCRLLNYAPTGPVSLKLSIDVEAVRRLTGRSSRRPLAVLPRFTQTWQTTMSAAEFFALRAATLAMQDEPILAPVWRHSRTPAASATLTGGLTVAYAEDWSTWAINPGDPSGYARVAPMLYGRFTQPPRLVSVNGEWVAAEFSVEEDSPAAYAIAVAGGVLAADTMFPTPNGYAAPVFPFLPDWSEMPQPSAAVVDVERQQIGPGRQKATIFFPQTPERLLNAKFTALTAVEEAQLIAWWIRRAGEADSHWVADSQAFWTLGAGAAAAATTLTIADGVAMPENGRTLALVSQTAIEIVRVQSTAGRVVTLTSALVGAWPTGTRVCDALLARHTNRELVFSGDAGPVCSASLSWRELAPEYATPAGETRGTTIGRLPGPAYFFKIELDYNGALRTWRLTNFESGATVGGYDWTYNACEFTGLEKNIDLEDDSATVRFRYFAGGPWDNWLPGRLAARGFITLYRADVDSSGALSNFAQFWRGELTKPDADGPVIKWKAIGANALFSRMCPSQLMGKPCWTRLFRARCGLALADWTFDATISTVSGNVVTISGISRSNGGSLPPGFGAADWFALGWMEWTETGAPMRDGVLTSDEISGGVITLTLDRPCSLAAGSSVRIVPGCDRSFATCTDKFANADNFRGFPFVPSTSPSFVLPDRQFSASKK